MKYVLSFALFFLSALIILISCETEKPAKIEETPEAVQEEVMDITTDMLTTNVDVVCGMDLTEHGIKDTTVYEGQLYGFCSQECKEKFLEDPQKYLAEKEEAEEAEETAEPE